MGAKRPHPSVNLIDGEDSINAQPSFKRQRKRKANEPQTDVTYGQRSVFPSLDDPTVASDDDLSIEDEKDALAYLRSVRQEASGIPHLMTAPRAGPQLPAELQDDDSADAVDRSIYYNGIGDSRGYYRDGAYTAAPDEEDEDEADEDAYGVDEDEQAATGSHQPRDRTSTRALREGYYAALSTRFASLRALLHTPPPAAALVALPPNHPTGVGRARSSTFGAWTDRLRTTDPVPAQVAAMGRADVLYLLGLVLRSNFLRRGGELRERTSRWLWALLARLPDHGEMAHEEVGVVRELGKRAVLLMASLAQVALLRREVELEGVESGDERGVEEGEKGEEHEDRAEVEGEEEEEEEEEEEGEEEEGELREGDDDNDEAGAGAKSGLPPRLNTSSPPPEPKPEPKESGSEDMDMDMDMEDGEVPSEPDQRSAQADSEDLETAKARLLGCLDEVPAAIRIEDEPRVDRGHEAFDEARARINMRATLNMILTVAGEFYGQRDLLEFRDPFTGM